MKHYAAIWYGKPEVTWIIYWIASNLSCLCLKRYCWWFGKSWCLNFSSVLAGVMAVSSRQSSTPSHTIGGAVIARSMCWKLSLSRAFQCYMKSQVSYCQKLLLLVLLGVIVFWMNVCVCYQSGHKGNCLKKCEGKTQHFVTRSQTYLKIGCVTPSLPSEDG